MKKTDKDTKKQPTPVSKGDTGRTYIKVFNEHYEMIAQLPDAERLLLYDAYFSYALRGVDTEFDEVHVRIIWQLIKTYLDASMRNFKNASKPRKKIATQKPNDSNSVAGSQPPINIKDKDKDKDKDNSFLNIQKESEESFVRAKEAVEVSCVFERDEKKEQELMKKYFARLNETTTAESIARMCHNKGISESDFRAAMKSLQTTWEEVPPEHHDTFTGFKKHLINATLYELDKKKKTGGAKSPSENNASQLKELAALAGRAARGELSQPGAQPPGGSAAASIQTPFLIDSYGN